MKIVVLGSGCKKCHHQYEMIQEVIKNNHYDVEVSYINNLQIIMSYGIMSLPAILIDDQLIASGKILNKDEIKKWIESRL